MALPVALAPPLVAGLAEALAPPLVAGLAEALAAGLAEALARALAAAGLLSAGGLDAGAAPPPHAARRRVRAIVEGSFMRVVVLHTLFRP